MDTPPLSSTGDATALIRLARDPTTAPGQLLAIADRYWASVHIWGNPDAPAAWLADHTPPEEYAVMRVLASNPNTPTDALARFAEPFPQVVLANPVLPLVLLEHPDWLLHLPANTALKMLACATMPTALVRQQARHANDCVREATAMHVALRGTTTDDWETEAHQALLHKKMEYAPSADEPNRRLGLWQRGFNPNSVFLLPGSLPRWLLQGLRDHPYRYNGLVARLHPDMAMADEEPDDAEGSVGYTRDALLGHPRYTDAAKDEESLATHLCTSTTSPPEILHEMAESKDTLLRWLLAQNPALPRDVGERLGDDLVYAVRDGILNNPRCPPALARKICAHLLMADVNTQSLFYRVLAFASPFVPSAFLARHAAAPDWLERYAIARNSQTPLRTLGGLAEDGVLVVRMAARAAVRAHLVDAFAQAPFHFTQMLVRHQAAPRSP